VAFAGGVLDERDMTGADGNLPASGNLELRVPAERDDELAARPDMPVAGWSGRPPAELRAGRLHHVRDTTGCQRHRDLFGVTQAVGASVDARRHDRLRRLRGNDVAIGLRFDTDKKRVVLTQADISNGEISVAGTGVVDYSGEPRLQLGFAGTPMSASALKRIWPILIVPEVREWVLERIEKGQLQRIDVAVNSPVRNLSRKGPPIPEEGLSVNIIANGVTVRPVDQMPAVRDADLKARVTGRTVLVTIGQGIADTPAGRKINFTDFAFEVPDMAPKPSPAKVRVRVDGPVPAAAEILAAEVIPPLQGVVPPS